MSGFTDTDVGAVTGRWIYARIRVLGEWHTIHAQVHRAWLSKSTPGALSMWVTRHHPELPVTPSYLVVCPGHHYTLADAPGD